MVVKFLVLAALISPALSECNVGCLICNPNGNCLLCDFVNAYYLFDNSCSRDLSGNCQFYQVNTPNASCLVCNDGYFLDASLQCVEVTTEIDNCKRYSSNSSCSECNPGYIIVGNTCVEVSNAILGCQIYASANATTCIECEDNYILSVDKASCTFNPSIRNCANFSYIECRTCATGNYLHQNAYLDNFKTSISNNNVTLINSAAFNFLKGSIDQAAATTCSTTDGTSCVSFNSLGVCEFCEVGNYLNENGECVINPIEPISFCSIYSSIITCEVCIAGYHLNAIDNCVPDAVINNCQSYNPSAKSTICVTCAITHYLTNNTCALRTNANIQSCGTYSVTQDRCVTCSGSNVMTTDGLKCMTPIENCISYNESTVNTETLICNGCDNTYYLNLESNGCIAGSIIDCLEYTTTSNVCVRCRANYYLLGNTCVERTVAINNCLSYAVDDIDRCATCQNASILFGVNRSCKAIQTISNCATYSSWNVCAVCNNGFYLSQNTCLSIPAAENCLQKSGNDCIQCTSNYYLEDGLCFIIPNITTNNCSSIEQSPNSPNACLGCNANFMPYSYTNKYLCRSGASVAGNTITNCIKYITANGGLECTKCQSTHIVSQDGLSCILNCASNQTVLIGDVSNTQESTPSPVIVNSYKKCFDVSNDESLEGCDVAATALNAPNNKKVCLKCKTGYIPIQTCPVEVSFFNADIINNNDLGASYKALECTLNANARYVPDNTTTPVTNCDYYVTDGNNNYYCKKCAFGFTSAVQVLNDISFMTCTQNVTGCNNTVRFGNALSNADWMEEMFGFNITHTYTCHKCTNEAEIPFLHLGYQNDLVPYGLTDNTPSDSENATELVVSCRQPTATGLSMTAQQFTSFPANCALGLYIVDKAKNSNTVLGTSALCLACKNGYKPTYDASGFLITGCTAISNCDTVSETDGWFNSCKVCASGFVYQYDVENSTLQSDVCVATANPNCFAVSSANNTCSVCNKNTVLNYDGVCEVVKPNLCTNFVDLSANNFDLSNTYNKLNLAYFFLLDTGCASCDGDFLIIRDSRQLDICNASPYVQAAVFPNPTRYIPRCASYYLGEAILCRVCENGYILNTNNNLCVLGTTFPNCLITNALGTACQICNSTTTRVGTNCVARSIANCGAYSEGSATLTCQLCLSGFVLRNNACVAGTISNCTVYDPSTSLCSSCNSGFVLVTESGISQQCMQIPAALNCTFADLQNENTELSCDACASGFSFTTEDTDMPDNTCVQINTVNNCLTYDIKEDLNASTFTCTLCDTLFYLRNGSCIGRRVTTGCRSYVATDDKCTACLSNFYLNEQGVCLAFIVGITNCDVYSDSTNCSRCRSGYFLSDNTCTVVDAATLIERCIHYSNATTCSVCDSGYVLTGNTCTQSIAQNCNTYVDVNNCSSCPTGYYLSFNASTQVTSCLEGNLANCAEIALVAPLTCVRCSGAFFVGPQGTCVPVTTAILNCSNYDNQTQMCVTCAPGYILSADRTNCSQFTGSRQYTNCLSLQYMNSAICTVCNSGYYFDQSICVKCSSQNYETGCAYCDYAVQSTCLMCRSGFYQDTDGSCKMNEQLRVAFENNVEHASLLSGFIIVLLGIFMITY